MSTAKNHSVSVRNKLKNLTTEDANYQQVLIRYMHERLLYRLSVSKYKDNFFLKGGVLLFAHERFLARPTIDIDFLGDRISRDKDDIRRTFIEILSVPCPEDGVVFDTAGGSVIAEDIILGREYNGVKVHFTGHLDTIIQKLTMDIGFGDVIIPHPVKLEYTPLIIGMPDFTINAYSLETVVAEKFQTMIVKSVVNSRMKDYYDVYTILRSGKLNRGTLSVAIKDVMENRDTHYEEDHPLFTGALQSNPATLIQWAAFLKKTKIKDAPSLHEVMNLIKTELQPFWYAMK